MQLETRSVVFADLDGTYLDDQYNCNAAKPIVNQLAALGGSVIFCSSKTRSEIEFYRKAAGINEPFIVENGGAIYIPKNYFPFSYRCTETAAYNVIRLSEPYTLLRKKLSEIKKKVSAEIVGFGDMTLEELAYDTGLPMNLAKLAQQREYDEPFRIVEGNRLRVMRVIRHEGLHCTQGGRYFHLTGNTDKGKAISILKSLYCQKYGSIHTFGVGDGPNDLPMLSMVDKPFLIGRTGSTSRMNTWTRILQHMTLKLPHKPKVFHSFDAYSYC